MGDEIVVREICAEDIQALIECLKQMPELFFTADEEVVVSEDR